MSIVYRGAPNLRREIIAFLKEKIDPDFIILFGSYAKGYARMLTSLFTKKAVC